MFCDRLAIGTLGRREASAVCIKRGVAEDIREGIDARERQLNPFELRVVVQQLREQIWAGVIGPDECADIVRHRNHGGSGSLRGQNIRLKLFWFDG